ncbi:MAG: MATE family efflux transporter [Planctomycetota bacterium]
MVTAEGPTPSMLPSSKAEPGGIAELWTLAYPVMVATLSQSMMGVVDTFYMGRVGTAEQGAVGLSMITFWTITSLFVGTVHGVATFAAQHFGARNFHLCGRDGWMGLYFSVPAALLLAGIACLSEPIFVLLGQDDSIVPHASAYISVRLYGAFAVLVNYTMVSFLRGIGDTKTPMYFAFGANVLNIIINYPLILGHWGCPAMGAFGAALGSVIATAIFSVAYLIFFLTGERHRRYQTRFIPYPRFKEMVSFLKIGLPIGGNWTLEMISWTAFMIIISRFGAVALAATEIVFEILHFSFLGAIALGHAATTLVGQYLGADHPGTAQKTAKSTILSSILYCVSMGVLFFTCRKLIVSWFSLDQAVIDVGARLFIYAAIFQFFDGLGISCTSVIRGAGDTRWPMLLMAIVAWGFFIPLTFVLTQWADMGIDGAWIAATLFIVTVSMGVYARYRSGRWISMRV